MKRTFMFNLRIVVFLLTAFWSFEALYLMLFYLPPLQAFTREGAEHVVLLLACSVILFREASAILDRASAGLKGR